MGQVAGGRRAENGLEGHEVKGSGVVRGRQGRCGQDFSPSKETGKVQPRHDQVQKSRAGADLYQGKNPGLVPSQYIFLWK